MKIISTYVAGLLLALPALSACNSPVVGKTVRSEVVDPPPQTTVLATSLMQPAAPPVVAAAAPVQAPPPAAVAPVVEHFPAHRRHAHRPAPKPKRTHAHEMFRSANNPD